jgi:hypothetical protein
VIGSLQDHLASAKNTESSYARKGDLHRAFPLDVLMVPSSVIIVATDSECLMCGGFSLSETIRLGNFKFITDYFGGVSLSPRRGGAGAAFMGSTHSQTSTPRRAMIEDGSFSLPSPRRRGTGSSLAPVTTTPWMENSLATQATTTVPPQMTTPQVKSILSFE